MSNIYNIQQELIDIFNEIEENNGELTPELEEALDIKQEEFKDKIKSYTDVIKMLDTDINAIKDERGRLYDLQKAKEKTIERLKNIIVCAIEMFGNTSKSGTKFVDYGTGKVSIRTTQSVEVDDDEVNNFVNAFVVSTRWWYDNNQLEEGLINLEEVIDSVNVHFSKDKDFKSNTTYTEEDIKRLNTSINFDINVTDLVSTKKGIDLLKALYEYNVFKVTAKPDKKGIKDDAKSEEHFMPVYAKLVNNKNITIK